MVLLSVRQLLGIVNPAQISSDSPLGIPGTAKRGKRRLVRRMLDWPSSEDRYPQMEEAYPSKKGTVRFDVYELDMRAAELRKQGALVKLQEQPFQILEILVERPGQVVTREELRQKIWPSNTFVDFDHGINNAIKRLRVALSDSAEKPRYIETVANR